MPIRIARCKGTLGLIAGLALGWTLTTGQGRFLRAGGGDSPDAALLTSGPSAVELNGATKVQVTKDAIYFLNYSQGRLLAALPDIRQTTSGNRVLSDFAEADLVKDFKLAPGTTPTFLMTTGSIGGQSDGSANLYVFETTTGQIAVYRITPPVSMINLQGVTQSSRPVLSLVELRQDRRLVHFVPQAIEAPVR